MTNIKPTHASLSHDRQDTANHFNSWFFEKLQVSLLVIRRIFKF